MNSFWDDNVTEHDLMHDDIEAQAQKVLEDLEEESHEEFEEEEEVVKTNYKPSKKKAAYSLDRRENSVVDKAMVKLEQARLYDMLIKHDMFKGVKAHPEALRAVKKELKDYIVLRLEVLLNMKKEPSKSELPKKVEVELPFNDIEIDFLKALSYKGTKGASASGDKKVLAASTKPAGLSDEPEEEEELTGLQSLQGDYEEDSYEPEYIEDEFEEEEEEIVEVKKKPARKRKVKPKAKATPRKASRKAVAKNKPSRARNIRKGQISDAEAERIALEEIERMKDRKPVHEMSKQELLEANSKITSNSTKAAKDSKPIPNSQQLSIMYQTKQAQMNANPNNAGFSTILNKVLASKK